MVRLDHAPGGGVWAGKACPVAGPKGPATAAETAAKRRPPAPCLRPEAEARRALYILSSFGPPP